MLKNNILSCWLIKACKRRMVNDKCKKSFSALAADHYLDGNKRYEDAIRQLNHLQTNHQVIQNTIRGDHSVEQRRFNETYIYLNRIGLTLHELDKLPVIHVSGTKGKGSTCSIVESILREHGLKTGFFSSPHLMSVNERFRINGDPISQTLFTEYFWKIFIRLNKRKSDDLTMPPYFKVLTLMAYHMFLEEKVDVAIIEVGIGGEFDCTNIVRNTRVVGITSLGLDHIQILGDTIRKIAWQKAGIIKKGSHVFTVEQPDDGNTVIKERTREKQAHLTMVPSFDLYSWSRPPNLKVLTKIHKLNMSLGIQMAYDWLKEIGKVNSNQNLLHLTEPVIRGLEKYEWPGRFQIIDRGQKRFFLDGAHTLESIEVCIKWFQEATIDSKRMKCLVMYITGQRDVEKLLKPVIENLNLDRVIITPNIVSSKMTIYDNVSMDQDALKKARQIALTFNEIIENNCPNSKTVAIVKPSVSDAFSSLSDEEGVDVLVTGSLYLIGTSLIALSDMK